MSKSPVHWRTESKSLLLLAALTVLYYWKIFFTHEYSLLTSNDNSRQWYAWYQFATHWLQRGVWPLWDPYTLSGNLFIGEAQPGLFYPINWLLFFLAGNKTGLSGHWIEWTIISSTFLLAAFQYALARTLGLSAFAGLVSAVCYAFGGFTGTIHFGHLGMFNSAIWTPVVFLFFLKSAQAEDIRRRLFYAMTAGLLLGVSILGGHIVPPMYAYGILALFALFRTFLYGGEATARAQTLRRMTFLLAVVGITAGGLAAVQLLPSSEYTKFAIRWVAAAEPADFRGKIPYAVEGVYGAVPPYHLLGFLIPNLAYLNGIYTYAGLLPVLLGLTAIFRAEGLYPRFFSFLFVLSLLYVLGNATIVHGIAYAVVPYLYVARIAHRALFITHFALAALAGFGMEIFIRHGQEKDHRAWVERRLKYLTGMTAALIIGGVGFFIICYLQGQVSVKADALNNVTLFLLMLSLSIGALYALVRRPLAMPGIKTLALGLMVIDIFSPVNAAMPLKSRFDGKENFEPGHYYRRTKILERLQEDGDRYFRLDAATEFPPPYGDMFGLFTTYGVSPTMLKDYHRFRSSDWYGASVLNLLNVKYLLTQKEFQGWEKVATDGDLSLYANRNYLPRAFVVPRVRLMESDQAILDAVNEEGFHPRAVLLLRNVDAAVVPLERRVTRMEGPEPSGPSSDVRILEYTPRRITLDVDAGAGGFLFLSEIYYPGWTARVDGGAAPVLKANYTFRAVPVAPGRHRVEMVFSPASFKTGLLITAITAALWVGAALTVRIRQAAASTGG